MLTLHHANGAAIVAGQIHAERLPDSAIWLDLLDPSEEERAEAERVGGLRVPARAEIVEIESSSRLRLEGTALYLSTPIVTPPTNGQRRLSAVAFVLAPTRLLTLRFTPSRPFDNAGKLLAEGGPTIDSATAFITILEAIIDIAADRLEELGTELTALSSRVFREDLDRNRRRQDAILRAMLQQIGTAADLIINIRESLLGIERIARFASENAAWMPLAVRSRVTTLSEDIASLNDYDAQLNSKVQFLLDATLGFLNIEQNNGIKILTVVSLVGIPPTLIASIYGMNFKNMPELNWAWGYPYGLMLILLSIVIPIGIFKWRGWL